MTVVDLQGRATREFKVGYLPHETAAAGSLVFLSNYGSGHVRSSDLTNAPGNTLSVVDLSRPDAATEVVDLGPGRCAPHGLAVSRDRQRLYVTCEGRQEVIAVDVKTRRILHAIPTNQAGSHMLALSADGSRAYVSNFWHGTVSVLDLQARRLLAHIPTGSGTEGISLSPDGRFVYTSSVYINEIVKIDTATLQVVGRATMSNCLGAVRVVPTPVDGATLVVNCADNGRVLIVEAGTLSIRHQIAVGTLPIGIGYRTTAMPTPPTWQTTPSRSSTSEKVLSCGRSRPATTRTASCFCAIDPRSRIRGRFQRRAPPTSPVLSLALRSRLDPRRIVLGDVELLELFHAAIASARVAPLSASRKSATKLM